MNSLLLFRGQMRLRRTQGWGLVGIDVVKTSHTASYLIESLAAEVTRVEGAGVEALVTSREVCWDRVAAAVPHSCARGAS